MSINVLIAGIFNPRKRRNALLAWVIALFVVVAWFSTGAQDAPSADPIRTGIFPFYKYAAQYNVWEYIPLDQGGREIQLQLIGSERDEDIIKAIRRPGFFAPWGDPIKWDSLEKTEPEKSVWLNRWYFLPCFARQYYLTGDQAYLREILAFMRKWRDENPAPSDLKQYFATRRENWRDMQVAWRMQNLAWCYFLGEKGYTAAEKRELYDLVKTHARVLLAYFGEQPLIENNHQSHGASAMLHAALLFPDLPEAAALKARAIEILNHHLDHAFYDDGNSVELVPGYYPFFASIFRDSYLLCRSNNVAPPPRSLERLRQFYDFMVTAQQPDGTMPPINDSTESSAVASIRVLADVLGLPDNGQPGGSHWFQASHQAVMRDTNSTLPAYIFLDAGPQVAAHWHGGKLGFHLWFWDKPLLVDSGISDYDDPLRRSWYWTPEAHNTVLVDGKGDYDKTTTKLASRPMAGSRIVQWESNEKYDWAVMQDTDFETNKAPVTWTRHFILIKGLAALVIDQFESDDEHDYTWLFHLPPCQPELDKVSDSVFTGLREKNLWVQPASPEGLRGVSIENGTVNQRGVNVSAPVVHFQRHGKSLAQAFLLAPVDVGQPSYLRVKQTVTSDIVTVRITTMKNYSAEIKIIPESSFSGGKYWLQFAPIRQ